MDRRVTGIVIGIVAIISMSLHEKHYWPILDVLLGVCLLVSILFESGETGMAWSNVVLGVMAIVTGAVSQTYEAAGDRTVRA